MFEYVRSHQRLMQFILLLFIVPSFALVGISSYLSSGPGEQPLVTIGNEKITQFEFDEALRTQMDRIRQRLGGQFDEAMFNTPEVKQSVLDNLIFQRTLSVEAKNEHLSIPDTVLQQNILTASGLTLPDGSFNYKEYKQILAARGMTPTMYENKLRQELAEQQLVSAVQGTAIAPKTLVAQVDAIMSQQREIQSLNFNAADFANQVTVTDAMLHAYYDKHSEQFAVPEAAKIEYVILNGEAVSAQMTTSDDEVTSYYEQNIKNYTLDEQRRASHILIKANKDASAADKAAAKAKAEEVLALVQAHPANFAELAKKYSQDDGSAQNGGDLDFFGKGMMVRPFEDTVYKLKEGETSGLVESDFGYHIIRLTGIKPATVKPVSQVKDQISAEIKKQKANKKFSEMTETFTNTVYEQSDSLKPVADKLKLSIQTANNVTRTPGAESALNENAVLTNPKFLKALFSDDAVKNKRNTEAVEIAPGTLVSARIVEYKPATKHPFDQVKETVAKDVKLAESEVLAQKAGEAKLTSLNASPDDKGFGATKSVSRTQPGGVPPNAFELIMKANTAKLPVFVGVNFPGTGYIVYRINKIEQPAADEKRTAILAKQVEDMLGSQNLFDFVQMLKTKEKVKIVKPIVSAPLEPTKSAG